MFFHLLFRDLTKSSRLEWSWQGHTAEKHYAQIAVISGNLEVQEEAFQVAISGFQGEGYLYSRCSVGQEGIRVPQCFKLIRHASCLLHLQYALGPSQSWRRPWIGFGHSSGLDCWLPRIYFWTLRPDRAGLHWQWQSITGMSFIHS